MAANNFFEQVCSGLENGDQIGGPTELARILCDSIQACGTFDKHDLTKRYLRWWKTDAFDTGPTFASVFTKIDKGIEPADAVKQTHKEFNNNTAGCGPAHRCAPLAGFMNIRNNQLISLARTEAKITHYHEDAGNGSAVVVMLCRHLLEGYNLKQAEILIAKDPELRSTWEKIAQADLKPDGYIFNVLHAALHFIRKKDPLEKVFKFAGISNYCPVIVGSIRACINMK